MLTPITSSRWTNLILNFFNRPSLCEKISLSGDSPTAITQARVPERKAETAGIVAQCHLSARSEVRTVKFVCILPEEGSIDKILAWTIVWIQVERRW